MLVVEPKHGWMETTDLSQVEALHYSGADWNVEKIPKLCKLSKLAFFGHSLPNEIFDLDLKQLELFTEYNPRIGQLVNLTRLRLSCQLTEVPPEIYNLKHLVALDLGKNLLTKLPEINKLDNLLELFIYSNQLRELHFDHPKLQSLYANHNQLESIDICCPQLTVLDLASNNLTNIEKITRLPRLEHLNVDVNQLSALPAFPNLKSLHCSDNKIVTMHYNYHTER